MNVSVHGSTLSFYVQKVRKQQCHVRGGHREQQAHSHTRERQGEGVLFIHQTRPESYKVRGSYCTAAVAGQRGTGLKRDRQGCQQVPLDSPKCLKHCVSEFCYPGNLETESHGCTVYKSGRSQAVHPTELRMLLQKEAALQREP